MNACGLFMDEPAGEPAAPAEWPSLHGGRFLLTVGLLLFLLLGGVWLVTERWVAQRRADLQSTLEARLTALAAGRAQAVAAWVQGIADLGPSLTRSELVRLYIAESALADTDPQLPPALAEERPYLRLLLDELAETHGFRAVYLLDDSGRPVLADSDAPPVPRHLTEELRGTGVPKRARFRLRPREEGGDVLLEVVLPVAPPSTADGSGAAVGALVLELPAGERLQRILRTTGIDLPGELAMLSFPADGARMVLTASSGLRLRRLTLPLELDEKRLALAELPNGRAAYGVAARIPGTGWSILQWVDRGTAEASLTRYRQRLLSTGLLVGLALVLCGVAWWWSMQSRHPRELARQYRLHSREMERQKKLTAAITENLPDPLLLCGADGSCSYANPAYRLLFGVSPQAAGSNARLPSPLAERVRDFVSSRKNEMRFSEVVLPIPGNRQRIFDITAALPPPEVGGRAIVVAMRDVTERVERRRARERLTAQTIAILVRAIERADPYLVGHSRRMASVAAAIARELGLSEEERHALETCCQLSQVGKLFVPPDLLRKEDRHSPEEQRQMRAHHDHLMTVLAGMEIPALVRDGLRQMYERLDGSGYPDGLRGKAIGRLARILAVADVFCARTSPRSYRSPLPPRKAFGFLWEHPERYDADVVAALGRLLERGLGKETDGSAPGASAQTGETKDSAEGTA